MNKYIRTGAVVVLTTNLLAACSYLPKSANEPEISAARAGSSLTIDGVLFDSDTAALQSEGQDIVATAVEYLLDNPDSKVVVEGHTDRTGSASHNQKLSEKRAGVIAKSLIAKGISEERISTVGYGESKPTADNNTPAGRQANRRVEIIFQ